VPAAFLQGDSPRYPLDTRLGVATASMDLMTKKEIHTFTENPTFCIQLITSNFFTDRGIPYVFHKRYTYTHTHIYKSRRMRWAAHVA
jgi:hypothetical protein